MISRYAALGAILVGGILATIAVDAYNLGHQARESAEIAAVHKP